MDIQLSEVNCSKEKCTCCTRGYILEISMMEIEKSAINNTVRFLSCVRNLSATQIRSHDPLIAGAARSQLLKCITV